MDDTPAASPEDPPESATQPANADHVRDPETDEWVTRDELRRRVEARYDFDDFGAADMAKMTADEWEAAFDADTWIVGPELLDRVERDLSARIADRSVFAVVDRTVHDGDEVLVAYSDEGYAIVYPDGSVEGEGTVLRDVEPSVALCSMDEYDVPDLVEYTLPSPEDVPEGTGELGNRMLQLLAWALLLSGVVLLAAPFFANTGTATIIVVLAGFGFLAVGAFLFVVVANARLSDRYRAEEYRERLRRLGVDGGNPPDFLPVDLGTNDRD